MRDLVTGQEKLVADADSQDESVRVKLGQCPRRANHAERVALPDVGGGGSDDQFIGVTQQMSRQRERISSDDDLAKPQSAVAQLFGGARQPGRFAAGEKIEIVNNAYRAQFHSYLLISKWLSLFRRR